MADQKKVLLAEDDASVRQVLRKELERDSIAVIEAADGQEALDKALAERPNVILLDVIMPKMHGMEILRKIQEDEWGKDVPIILLTNFADDPKVAEAVKEGRCELINKAETNLTAILKAIKDKLK